MFLIVFITQQIGINEQQTSQYVIKTMQDCKCQYVFYILFINVDKNGKFTDLMN